MSKFRKAQGIILKKQNYRETDQIITIWTSEFGKLRVLARGLRKPGSKLSGALQDLSFTQVDLAGSWPTVISAASLKNFRGIRSNLAKIAPAAYACELMLKMTADEHPDERAFNLLLDFLSELDSDGTEFSAYTMIDIYALNLSEILGFGRPKEISSHRDVRNFIEGVIERAIKSEPFLFAM
ncbi:MAG TPA: DNA repair protein RecO [Patescibacteria group bacterium]|nr:DNA repair protein RecO [Patescibacteria group bacterium]